MIDSILATVNVHSQFLLRGGGNVPTIFFRAFLQKHIWCHVISAGKLHCAENSDKGLRCLLRRNGTNAKVCRAAIGTTCSVNDPVIRCKLRVLETCICAYILN